MKGLLFAALVSTSPVAEPTVYDVKLAIQRKIWSGRTDYFIDFSVNGRLQSHCNLDGRDGLVCNSMGTTITIHEITPDACNTMVSWDSRAFACVAKFVSEEDSWITPKYTNYLCTKRIEDSEY